MAPKPNVASAAQFQNVMHACAVVTHAVVDLGEAFPQQFRHDAVATCRYLDRFSGGPNEAGKCFHGLSAQSRED